MPRELDERSFFMKVKRYARRVSFIPDALALYFCMVDKATPPSIKTIIAVALAYFVLPTDAIHDWIPFSGLVDDSAVIALTLGAVQATHVTDEHRQKAHEWLSQ